MERVEVTREFLGFCHMQVCAVEDATDEEILVACNKENPSGTSLGWCRVMRSVGEHDNGNMLPVTCQEHGNRKHFLVSC